MRRPITFVEVKSGLCAPCARGKLGAELGIDAIKDAAITNDSYIFIQNPSVLAVDTTDHRKYAHENFEVYKQDLHYNMPNDRFARHIKYLLNTYKKTAQSVQNVLEQGQFPFILAGDHSTAGGTMAGIKAQYPDKRLGVIWIDAHADLHSPFTTPSGNIHGMPVACAMGFTEGTALEVKAGLEKQGKKGTFNMLSDEEKKNWKELCHIGGDAPAIKKEDFVFIGIRDIEPEEKWYIDTYIKNFNGEYLHQYGIQGIVSQTLEYLAACDIIYVSFDIDSIDGRIVRGTGTPVKDGLSQYQAQELLKGFYESEKLVAMEIVEINPLLDDDAGNALDTEGNSKACQFETRNGTAEIAFQIIQHVVA